MSKDEAHDQDEDAADADDGEESGGTLMVELLSTVPLTLDREAFYAALERRVGEVQGADEGPLQAFLLEHTVEQEGGRLPVGVALLETNQETTPDSLDPALRQTWDWEEAEQVAGACSHAILLTELTGRGLDREERLECFTGALLAALEVLEVDALHWPATQRLVDPSVFEDAASQGAAFFAGPTNVRLFKVEGEPDHTLMDTIGMAAFELPDVQLHFSELDLDDVGPFLFNLAHYLFGQGDVIEDGDTVQGIEESHLWPCTHERSRAQPDRAVIDVDPSSA
jgi:Domain of unknown function (DUF4261)